MKLWLISQTENTGYDTFDSAVVAAETEEEAARIHPAKASSWEENRQLWDAEQTGRWGAWCKSPSSVTVKYIGEACAGTEQGVICASFNAG